MGSIDAAAGDGEPGQKGLKGGALGFISGVVIGVASTAPGYSLAASLGLVTAAVGLQSPAIMLVAFIPMLFIAAAYYYLNKADPDCGTTFSWVTKAMGPWAGWIGGWGIIVADIIVMANLAEIAGIYSFSLFGYDNPGKYTVLAAGVAWIIVMTWICYVGIEVSAKIQWGLLAAELATLVAFSIVALIKVYTMKVHGEVDISLSWFNPLDIHNATSLSGLNPFGSSASPLAVGMILAIFIYWGWDSTVTVNEESADSTEGPGKAAVWSTIILVAIYVVVSVAAQAYHGAGFLSDNSDDVLGALGRDVMGSPWDKLLIIAVLTSASASTQTTILPTTRTMLSMAAKRAIPRYFARVHSRYLTPSTSTVWMGGLSVAWYVGLTLTSENVLGDAIAGLGLAIAFYYGLTGWACPIFYRHELTKSVKNFVMVLVAPVIGAVILTWALFKSIHDYADPANSVSGTSWFGLGPPLVIFIGMFVLGIVLMFWQYFREPDFFRRRPEVAPAGILDSPATPAPTPAGD